MFQLINWHVYVNKYVTWLTNPFRGVLFWRINISGAAILSFPPKKWTVSRIEGSQLKLYIQLVWILTVTSGEQKSLAEKSKLIFGDCKILPSLPKRKTGYYAISNEGKFICEALGWYIPSLRVKDVFLVTIHPDNMNGDIGMEIP